MVTADAYIPTPKHKDEQSRQYNTPSPQVSSHIVICPKKSNLTEGH